MPDNTQKNLKEIFGLKMMVKSGLEQIILKFHDGRVAAAQCKKICPERLNWPGRLVLRLDHFEVIISFQFVVCSAKKVT